MGWRVVHYFFGFWICSISLAARLRAIRGHAPRIANDGTITVASGALSSRHCGSSSRSDASFVAVGDNPRNGAIFVRRRVATVESSATIFNRRHATRIVIVDLLGQPHSFSRAFDMIYIPRFEGEIVTQETIDTHIDEITLIELKVTRKCLPESPKGFFFGATRNEFRLARNLGNKFHFCLVCLHPDSPSAIPLSLMDLKKIIRTRRVQYQINL